MKTFNIVDKFMPGKEIFRAGGWSRCTVVIYFLLHVYRTLCTVIVKIKGKQNSLMVLKNISLNITIFTRLNFSTSIQIFCVDKF